MHAETWSYCHKIETTKMFYLNIQCGIYTTASLLESTSEALGVVFKFWSSEALRLIMIVLNLGFNGNSVTR